MLLPANKDRAKNLHKQNKIKSSKKSDMNCKNHLERPAVSVCPECGCGLCTECSNSRGSLLCADCRKTKKAEDIASSIAYLVVFAVLFFTGYKPDFLPSKSGEDLSFLSDYFLVALVTGWQVFNSLLRNTVFVFCAETAWLYTLLKLVVYIVIGFFLAPVVIVWNIVKVFYHSLTYASIR